MSGSPDRRDEGLFASLKTVSATVLAMGQTRLELLGNEIETQKLLALRILMLAQALMFCAGLGVLLLVMLLAVLAGEQRAWVIGGFAAVFVLAALGFYRSLMRVLNTPDPPFAASLAELQEDIRNLKAATGHANKAD